MRKLKRKLKKYEERIQVLENVISQEILKVDIQNLEHADIFEIVAMFHIENRMLMPVEEYYRYHTEINTITGETPFEYMAEELKRGIVAKMSQLLAEGRLPFEVKIYVNKPMKVRGHAKM